MLLNDFYKLIDAAESEAGWNFNVELNPNHNIYQGHFPEQPIVPGVCLLQIIRECAESVLKQKTLITQISSCKYLAVVNPQNNSNIQIHLSMKESNDGEYTLLANGRFGETDFIKLKASLKVV